MMTNEERPSIFESTVRMHLFRPSTYRNDAGLGMEGSEREREKKACPRSCKKANKWLA